MTELQRNSGIVLQQEGRPASEYELDFVYIMIGIDRTAMRAKAVQWLRCQRSVWNTQPTYVPMKMRFFDR